MDYSDETADEMAAPPGPDRRPEPLGPRRPGRHRHGGAALPARRRRVSHPLGRRGAPRRALQAAARGARHAAPRRAHQPPRRRDHRLAPEPPDRVQGHDPDRDPRPLLPRRHHRLDPRARPRPRHPLRGQLLRLARAEGQAAPAGGARGQGQAEDPGARARMDPPGRPRPPGQVQGPHQRLQRDGQTRPSASAIGQRPDHHPQRPAPRRQGDRGRGPEEAHGRQAPDRGPDLLAPARRHRRRDRPQRRRQDHALPDAHRAGAPDAGTVTFGDTVKLAYVDQSRDTLNPDATPSGRRSPAAPSSSSSATPR